MKMRMPWREYTLAMCLETNISVMDADDTCEAEDKALDIIEDFLKANEYTEVDSFIISVDKSIVGYRVKAKTNCIANVESHSYRDAWDDAVGVAYDTEFPEGVNLINVTLWDVQLSENKNCLSMPKTAGDVERLSRILEARVV